MDQEELHVTLRFFIIAAAIVVIIVTGIVKGSTYYIEEQRLLNARPCQVMYPDNQAGTQDAR